LPQCAPEGRQAAIANRVLGRADAHFLGWVAEEAELERVAGQMRAYARVR
jgi:hypothetical protein